LEIEKVNPVAVATGVVAVGTTESGKSLTTVDAAEVTDVDDPTPLVATTDTMRYLLMSSSVNTYVLVVAEEISEYEPPADDARFH
jgi:hypothetical protein